MKVRTTLGGGNRIRGPPVAHPQMCIRDSVKPWVREERPHSEAERKGLARPGKRQAEGGLGADPRLERRAEHHPRVGLGEARQDGPDVPYQGRLDDEIPPPAQVQPAADVVLTSDRLVERDRRGIIGGQPGQAVVRPLGACLLYTSRCV